MRTYGAGAAVYSDLLRFFIAKGEAMENLPSMAIFAHVVETKSFSAAARRLNMSKSQVSKHVTQLEKSLGARLLNRTTRAMSLTDAGAVLYEYCAHIVEELDAAKRQLSQLRSEPRGLLNISSSVAFGSLHIVPFLPEFLSLYPAVKVSMTLTDRFVDLAEEGYDVTIRITQKPAENLVARRLARASHTICATPEYFARHGTPQMPADLERHNCLTYTSTSSNSLEPWRLQGPEGEIPVHASGNLKLDNAAAMSRAVLSGLGIALLPTFIISQDLQAGRLQSVLSGYSPLERSVYAIYLPNRHLPSKVRAFIDYLLERFGPEPYWERVVSAPDRQFRHAETQL
jgi:DNA-binding transcriptional LysR family regulator